MPISFPEPTLLLVSDREERELWEQDCFESRKSYSYLNLNVATIPDIVTKSSRPIAVSHQKDLSLKHVPINTHASMQV